MLESFLQFGLSLGKRQTNLLMCQGYKNKTKQNKNKTNQTNKKTFARLQNLDLLRPGLVKSLKPHIPMSKWSYFKVLYHSIHDVSQSIISKNRKQNTWVKHPEKILQAKLLKKFHCIIFTRLSAIIHK